MDFKTTLALFVIVGMLVVSNAIVLVVIAADLIHRRDAALLYMSRHAWRKAMHDAIWSIGCAGLCFGFLVTLLVQLWKALNV